jgi:hypothetical protein
MMKQLQAAKYRNRAQYALEVFQRDDELGPSDRREAGFEYFVRRLLETLQERAHLLAFGLSVASQIEVAKEEGAASILVHQRVRSLEQGISNERIDIEAFYSECFPRNAVFDGEFLLTRSDELFKRYQAACTAEAEIEQFAVIAILSRRAEEAFSPSNVRFFFQKP